MHRQRTFGRWDESALQSLPLTTAALISVTSCIGYYFVVQSKGAADGLFSRIWSDLDRQKLNTVSGIIPMLLSLGAFALVIFAVMTGWDKGDPDEGTPAHIFQLLIVAQVPFIMVFIATADWAKARRVARMLALQAAALAIAFAPVAIFRL